MELRQYHSLEIGFGQLYQIYSDKQAHFLFSKTILNVGRARAATVDFVKYIHIEIGGLECVVDHVARHNYAEPIWLTLVGKSVGRLL